MSVLALTGVTMRYDLRGKEITALPVSSLTVDGGEFLVVRGASGSGKTTLLSIAGGMLRPSAGSVQVDGVDLTALNPGGRARVRRASIGFVFQGMYLLPYLDLLDNVRLAGGTDQGARDFLEQLGLGARLHHRPDQLSAGERQRGAVARALVHGPSLVLADEPTGNLDPESGALVLSALEVFCKAGGSLVMATHSQQSLPVSRTLHLGAAGLEAGCDK